MLLMLDIQRRNNAFGSTLTTTNGLSVKALLLQLADGDYMIWSGTNVDFKYRRKKSHLNI